MIGLSKVTPNDDTIELSNINPGTTDVSTSTSLLVDKNCKISHQLYTICVYDKINNQQKQ